MARGGRLGSVAIAVATLAVAPRALADGDGFKIGEAGRLHLYGQINAGYDSNALFASSGAAVGSGVMDFIPGLKLDVAGHMVSLTLDANLDYKLYLSSEAQAYDLSHLFGGASLGFDVNKEGTIGLQFSDAFTSSPNTTSLSLDQSTVSNYNVLNLAIPWRPGGGALTITGSGQWMLNTFETYGPPCNPAAPNCTNANEFNFNQYGAKLQGKWAFLPRTAAVLEGSWFDRVPTNTSVSYPVQGVRVLGGGVGLVTSRLSATVEGGWGSVIDTPQVTGSTWLANVELGYTVEGIIDARVGWIHDFAADVGTAYSVYDYDRVYLSLRWVLNRFTVKLDGSWEYVKYILNDVTGPIWQVTPAVDCELARWLIIGAYYTYSDRSTTTAPGQTTIPAFNYSRNQIFGYVRATW